MGIIGEIRIKAVHTILDFIIAAIVTAAGVGVYFVLPGWGILFCLIGILLFVFYKRFYKRVGDSTPLKKRSMDLAPDCREEIISFLEGKTDEMELVDAPAGDHLYFEVYFNTDSSVAYAQLYDVAENRFESATKMIELKGPKAQTLIAKL